MDWSDIYIVRVVSFFLALITGIILLIKIYDTFQNAKLMDLITWFNGLLILVALVSLVLGFFGKKIFRWTQITIETLPTITEISLLGLGLVIALYTIILDKISHLSQNRMDRLKELTKKRDILFEKLEKDKSNRDLSKEYDALVGEINSLLNVPYHYDFGYVISGLLFFISLFLSCTFYYYPNWFIGNNLFTIFTPLLPHLALIFIIGVLNFFYVWFRTMVDARNKTFVVYDKLLEKEQKKKVKK